MDIFITCIGDEGVDGGNNISMPSVNKRVKPLQLFEVLVASYFVDLLINHGHHLEEYIVSLLNISCSPLIFHIMILTVTSRWRPILERVVATQIMSSHPKICP